jgi:hypothetical protein
MLVTDLPATASRSKQGAEGPQRGEKKKEGK